MKNPTLLVQVLFVVLSSLLGLLGGAILGLLAFSASPKMALPALAFPYGLMGLLLFLAASILSLRMMTGTQFRRAFLMVLMVTIVMIASLTIRWSVF